MDSKGRERSDSVRSGVSVTSPIPTVPQNTPDNRSTHVTGTDGNIDPSTEPTNLGEHVERAEREEPGTFWEHDTVVPENTPATGSPASHYRPQVINLPSIDESLEQLPPPATSPLSSNEGFSVVSDSKLGVASAPASAEPSTPARAATEGMSPPATPDPSFSRLGDMENADWLDEVEEDMSRVLGRLANLAKDDHHRDPTKSAEEYYRLRVKLLLDERTQGYAYASPFDLPTFAPVTHPLVGSADRVTCTQFRELVTKVDGLNRRLDWLKEMQNKQNEDIKKELEDIKHHLRTGSDTGNDLAASAGSLALTERPATGKEN